MTRPDDTLTSPYRAVRPIEAPADGPWPGMLTCLPTGERRVLVDAEVLGTGWRGWDAAPDGHVLAALDVVRRQGGHDVVLPVCSEPLEAYLSRRRASSAPLTRGEAVTIGVSLLRGCAEALDGESVTGAWWLTETGRPVFATDAAAPSILECTVAVLDGLAGAAPHATAWAEAIAALSTVRLSASELDRAEVGLFSLGAAAPLDLAPSSGRAAAPHTRPEPVAAVAEEPPRPGLWESLLRHVDADLADIVSRATTSLWRRTRASPRRRRRAPLAVGAAVAVAVVGIGLMWPGEPGDVATAESGRPSASAPGAAPSPASASPHPSRSAAPHPAVSGGADAAPDADSEGSADLAVVAASLLVRSDECGGDAACHAGTTVEGAGAAVDRVDVPPERREIVLLDDFGGVAVLRLDDTAGEIPSLLIVIARQNGEWLLRDVHDATQQP